MLSNLLEIPVSSAEKTRLGGKSLYSLRDLLSSGEALNLLVQEYLQLVSIDNDNWSTDLSTFRINSISKIIVAKMAGIDSDCRCSRFLSPKVFFLLFQSIGRIPHAIWYLLLPPPMLRVELYAPPSSTLRCPISNFMDANIMKFRVVRFKWGHLHLPCHSGRRRHNLTSYFQSKIHISHIRGRGINIWIPGIENQLKIQCLWYATWPTNHLQQEV